MHATIGFLLFDGVEELDFVGPWEILSVWGNKFNGPDNIVTLSQHNDIIKCANRLQVVSMYDFSNCPKLDYLIVPGGIGTRAEVANIKVIDYIKATAKNCQRVLSVCTGSFLLQAAGLLDGKSATTHWASLNRLREFSKTTVVEERIVKDGNIWTSAGISAGIDLAFALIADISGDNVAGQVQFQTEYYPSHQCYGNLQDSKQAPLYLSKK